MPITEVEGRRLPLSNLEKVIYPSTGTTKSEVLHYYATIAGTLLPHLYARPLSFLRYPDGVEGDVFFTKNVPGGAPEWVKTFDVTHSSGGTNRHVLIEDLASLMWAANLVVEFHTPQWRADADGPGIADRLIFDLDPGQPADILDCCRAAHWLRDRLSADGLSVYSKTSGSKGLHLVSPIEPAPAQHTTAYAKAIAVEAQAALPDLVVHKMTRRLRPGKVLVDYSQNAAAKTTAAPYTLRARSAPTVSTPVTWDELAGCAGPEQLVFQAGDIAGRLDRYGDLLGPLLNLNRARPLPGRSGAP